MENEINAVQSFPRMGLSVTSSRTRSEIGENTNVQCSILGSSDESVATVDEKPKKILRKLRKTLRKEVKDELREDLIKSKNLEDKVDRANVRFKEKVFETLKQAAQRDEIVKVNLERIRREKVQKKILTKYNQCRTKLKAEIERRKEKEEMKQKKLEQRRKNMEKRMKWYMRNWKIMIDRKCFYRKHTRKEMEMMRLCRKGLYVNPNVECPEAEEPDLPQPDPCVRSDMLTLVLHMIARRVVHHATSHILCYLLTEAEQCVLNISPKDLQRLNKSGMEMCSENVANLLKDAAESYVPSLPPPGFLSNLFKICCHKPIPTKVKSLPEKMFKLKCPCEESTPELTEASVSAPVSAIPSPTEAPARRSSASVVSIQSIWSNESDDSDNSDETDIFENSSPEMPKSAPTDVYHSSSTSSNSVCDSNNLLPSDDSIQYYFKKYNIRHDGQCGEVSNPIQYAIRAPQICSGNSRALGIQSDDSNYSLCFLLKRNREPLTSNNIYDLLHRESREDDPCNSHVVVEQIKVPKKVNPVKIAQTQKPIPKASTKDKKPREKQRPVSTTTSNLYENSMPNAGSIYWLYNSLKFLSTKVPDLLCKLISTVRPPLRLSFEPLAKFSQMEEFENFLSALFERNFDVINNDSLVFFVEKFFYFVWLSSYRCPDQVYVTY